MVKLLVIIKSGCAPLNFIVRFNRGVWAQAYPCWPRSQPPISHVSGGLLLRNYGGPLGSGGFCFTLLYLHGPDIVQVEPQDDGEWCREK